MPARIYLVKDRTTGEPRLVEAVSQAAAIAHVARATHTVHAATTADVISLAVLRGIPIEKAGGVLVTPEPADHDPAGMAPGERA